jgi:predicted TIM-barrel fold metal-dependent hydrolase
MSSTSPRGLSRREFLRDAAVLAVAAAAPGCQTAKTEAGREPIIDIHQHVGYSGRPDEVLIEHQRAMGVSKTILLPAGHNANTPATHHGKSNGLAALCLANEACYRLALAHRGTFYYGANEVPDLPEAVATIEQFLKCGAVILAEQKFGVECDAPEMQQLYRLAADYRVPILMHWEYQRYNYGFERFGKMLAQFPDTIFIGHAQTWWANIDQGHANQAVLYPKGKVTPGGFTDRYLADYPNMYGDLSAGSGLNALTRDEEFTRDFLARHQDKLLYGSDCNDWEGRLPNCQGAQTIAAVRRLAASKQIERKLLYENARKMFRL